MALDMTGFIASEYGSANCQHYLRQYLEHQMAPGYFESSRHVHVRYRGKVEELCNMDDLIWI
jgi:hypothetical protein